ncbi:MAG: hypothetical protein ACTSSI_17335 [Candidatus Helarchaeota archaeon]
MDTPTYDDFALGKKLALIIFILSIIWFVFTIIYQVYYTASLIVDIFAVFPSLPPFLNTFLFTAVPQYFFNAGQNHHVICFINPDDYLRQF